MQTLELVKLRGVAEQEFLRSKQGTHINIVKENINKLEQEKDCRDRKKQETLEEERNRIELLNTRGIKQVFNPVENV